MAVGGGGLKQGGSLQAEGRRGVLEGSRSKPQHPGQQRPEAEGPWAACSIWACWNRAWSRVLQRCLPTSARP